MKSARTLTVVDPIWAPQSLATIKSAWAVLLAEAHERSVLGVDMEWTPPNMAKNYAKLKHTKSPNHLDAAAAAAARKEAEDNLVKERCRIGTVQLSTKSCTFVVKLIDLVRLCDNESGFPPVIHPAKPNRKGNTPKFNNEPQTSIPAEARDVSAYLMSELQHVLADSKIVKVGVGIFGDKKKLTSDYPSLILSPCVDLITLMEHTVKTPSMFTQWKSGEATQKQLNPQQPTESGGVETPSSASPSANPRPPPLRSLKDLAHFFTGRELKKEFAVVCSDWGTPIAKLSNRQVMYAAADADASYEVCTALLDFYSYEQGDSSGTAEHVLLHKLVGCGPTKQKPAYDSESTGKADVKKGGRFRKSRKPVGRAKPYYDNINVYDPNMQLLFTVDRTKAMWYVYKKQLGRVIEWREKPTEDRCGEGTKIGGIKEDAARESTENNSGAANHVDPNIPESDAAFEPTSVSQSSTSKAVASYATEEEIPADKEIAAIQLSFTPNFAKFNDAHIRRNMEYFRYPKENRCVVCGDEGELIRFAVVPLMYRKYFPSVYMSHNSYDLLLMCTQCSPTVHVKYDEERKLIAEEYGFPLAHHQTPPIPGSAKPDSSTANSQKKLYLSPEYIEIEHFRAIIVNILKFAKALHRHYKSEEARDKQTATTEAVEAAEGLGDAEDDDAAAQEEDVKPVTESTTQDPSADTEKKPSKSQVKKNTRKSIRRRGGNRFEEACLPQERLDSFSKYIREHAVEFPFVDVARESKAPRKRASGRHDFTAPSSGATQHNDVNVEISPDSQVNDDDAAAAAIVAYREKCIAEYEADPASPGGVSVIVAPATYHHLLSKHLGNIHPEWAAGMPVTTRKEEDQYVVDDEGNTHLVRGGEDDDDEDDGDDGDSPYLPLDSHGCHVVRSLLHKYDKDPEKTSDHAMGEFIYRWRMVFMTSMKPQHLPQGWAPEDGILLPNNATDAPKLD